jgi:hypothetical protein
MYENLVQHIQKQIQLRELVHSVVVEQLPEHKLACGSELKWERGEGEVVAEQQPPRAPCCEAVTPSRG